MRIIFMGTPEFAVPSLEILVNAGYEIVGVITSADKLGGRGRKTLIESAVKKYAVSQNLKVLQPKNLKSPKFLEELKQLKADLQIVVAFRMLPVVVWDMPPQGTYNLHGSLLPKYRGAAPINWAVIKGEKVTGVTTFKLKHEIDTGSILFQKEIKIYPYENATDVHDKMMYVGASVVLETVNTIKSGEFKLIEQNNENVTHAPKLNRANTKIDFSKNIDEINNFIRGLSQYPAAWMNLGDKELKVYACNIERVTHSEVNGSLHSDNKSYLKIACSGGFVHLIDIKPTGKRRMLVKDFLNGFDINQIT